ncbi:MAG: hypothetical protein ACLP7P_19065, partial [Rhodomicrobium sp.]
PRIYPGISASPECPPSPQPSPSKHAKACVVVYMSAFAGECGWREGVCCGPLCAAVQASSLPIALASARDNPVIQARQGVPAGRETE